MPSTVKGLLLGLLSVLAVLEWIASPQGWAMASYGVIYWGVVASGLSDGINAIALSITLATLGGVLLFEPADHPH